MAQMAIKIETLVAVSQVLDSIDEKLPLRLAVKVGRLQKALAEWLVPFRERQQDIIQKYLAEGEVEIRSDHPEWGTFVTEMNALMLEDADIDSDPLTVGELEGHLELSARDAHLLIDAGLLTD